MAARSPLDLLLPWAAGGKGMGFNESDKSGDTDALKQQVLAQMKSVDPNAHLDESNQFVFDASKLPKFAGGDPQAHGGWGNLINTTENDAGERIRDPRYLIKDANYGDWTYRGNVNQASNDAAGGGVMGQLQTYMPAVISSIMAMASGGAMSPGLIQAITGASEGGGIMDLLRIIGSSVANSYVPGSGTAINLAAGAAQRGR